MARFSVACKLGAAPASFTAIGHVSDVVNSVSTATVNTDVATLVADGASPTQAHVNTLNTDWTALKAGTGAIPAQTDVVLSFDAAVVGTKAKLRAAIEALLRIVEGSDNLT